MIAGGWEFVRWAYGITYTTLALYAASLAWRNWRSQKEP